MLKFAPANKQNGSTRPSPTSSPQPHLTYLTSTHPSPTTYEGRKSAHSTRMLSTARTRLPRLLSRHFLPPSSSLLSLHQPYSTASRTSDRVPTNDPNPPAPAQNVSETNALPSSPAGNRDMPLQEMPEDSERQRQMQAPNRKGVWSRSQAERAQAMSGPRFEQTIMEYQVRLRILSVGFLVGVVWGLGGGVLGETGRGRLVWLGRREGETAWLVKRALRLIGCNNFAATTLGGNRAHPQTTRPVDHGAKGHL